MAQVDVKGTLKQAHKKEHKARVKALKEDNERLAWMIDVLSAEQTKQSTDGDVADASMFLIVGWLKELLACRQRDAGLDKAVKHTMKKVGKADKGGK